MQLTCPHCGFSKEVPAALVPPGSTTAHCPKCKSSFPLKPKEANRASTSVPLSPPRSPRATGGDITHPQSRRPKAGFWLRLVAWFFDNVLVGMMQIVLGSLLYLAGDPILTQTENGVSELVKLIFLFMVVTNFVYFGLFTGYCGQTPGKMAVRIKVIRCDDHSISYGRAFFREVPSKFVSAVILGIGYLMVAFDEQKQGLHDRMADTYVVKL